MRSPCSLGRVPTSVTTSSASCARPPAIMEDLHTIADLRDPDQIRRDSDAGATWWPRDQPWITCTMHRTRACLAPGPGHAGQSAVGPVLPEDGWRHRRAWRRRNVPQYRGCTPTPTIKIQEAELFHGRVRHDMLHEGYGTIAGNPTRQAAAVSPSGGLRVSSIFPSARATLGVLGHARSDSRTLNSFRNLARSAKRSRDRRGDRLSHVRR